MIFCSSRDGFGKKNVPWLCAFNGKNQNTGQSGRSMLTAFDESRKMNFYIALLCRRKPSQPNGVIA
jgi:hypothetical protein